ncbi:MAG: glycosyltransferase, partial [Candidatus Eremiobacteraeota bacterium]|nr:glycosyltransferase [Candidatus Eremiobacteraeota bacterium]
LAQFGAGRRSAAVRARYGVEPGERLALFVSRLALEKNAAVLLEALALARAPARLVLAGEGPDRERLAALAERLGLRGRAVFAGQIAREALPELYASADVFVFPSVTETQGLVLAEALAAGCPAIAVDTPQAREVLGTAATYVSPTPQAIAEAIDAVPAEPAAGSAAAARAAAARFDVVLQRDRLLGIYRGLAAGHIATPA